jgi:hypothetical protein
MKANRTLGGVGFEVWRIGANGEGATHCDLSCLNVEVVKN